MGIFYERCGVIRFCHRVFDIMEMETGMKRYLVGSCAFNESEKVRRVIQKYNDYARYDVLMIDDGSTDGSLANAPQNIPLTVIRNETTTGAGHCIRQIFEYALAKGYEAVLFAFAVNDSLIQVSF